MFSKLQQTSAKKVRKPKKIKLPSHKKLVKMLDDVIRDILKFYPDECCCCGQTGLGVWHPKNNPNGLQVGHYIGRGSQSLKWDLRNCHRQCSGCNAIHRFNPVPYTRFMVRTYGHGILEDLDNAKKNHVKFSNPELRELLEKLTREKERLANL